MSSSLDVLKEATSGLTKTIRKMFGGHGFFAPNGGMFAGIVTDDAIVLKLVRGPLRDEFIALGGRPWVYTGGKKPMTMQEWLVVPEHFYDDYDLLGRWAARARASAPEKVQGPLRTKGTGNAEATAKGRRSAGGNSSTQGPKKKAGSASVRSATQKPVAPARSTKKAPVKGQRTKRISTDG